MTVLVAVAALAAACARVARPAPAPMRIVVLSDLNGPYGSVDYGPEVSHAIELTVETWRPDLVLIAGDMIAGQRPALPDERVRAMWAAFDSVVAEPLRRARIPVIFTLGNHDASGFPAHARDRRIAAEYWRSAAGAGVVRPRVGEYPFHYAVSIEDIFVVALDATTARTSTDSTQLAWLRRVLRSDAARAADMRIVLAHVPLHAVAEGRNQPGEVQDDPEALKAILEQEDVRLFVAGHHHAYYPARDGALEMLHAGAVGDGPRPLIGSSLAPYRTVTVLDVWPARDSIVDRTYQMTADTLHLVDIRSLPPRIDGINGPVVRRDVTPP